MLSHFFIFFQNCCLICDLFLFLLPFLITGCFFFGGGGGSAGYVLSHFSFHFSFLSELFIFENGGRLITLAHFFLCE